MTDSLVLGAVPAQLAMASNRVETLTKHSNIFGPAKTASKTIEEGSSVIVYISRDALLPIHIETGQTLNTRYGRYAHGDLIGKKFGSKVQASIGTGYCHLLRPTPELWTMALSHRTQILYLPDIAFITSYLDIRPGSKVIEAGTGSGSFSHSIARTVGSKGTVYSFEFHEQRCQQAREEFRQHGLLDIIQLEHRNVCKDGFGDTTDADAVFLDLPAPWEAVAYAKASMARTHLTRICCFSPCMEQVIKTVASLHEHGFTSVTMYEMLSRQHDSSFFPVVTIDSVIQRLQDLESKKVARRDVQRAASRAHREEAGEERKVPDGGEGDMEVDDGEEPKAFTNQGSERADNKRKAEEFADGSRDAKIQDNTEGGPTKRQRPDASSTNDNEVSIAVQDHSTTVLAVAPVNSYSATPTASARASPSATIAAAATAAFGKAIPLKNKKDGEKIVCTRPAPQIRGHTSYLTFAFLLPLERSRSSEKEDKTDSTSANGAEEIRQPATQESYGAEYAKISNSDMVAAAATPDT